jgi:hypothetical protein
MQNSEALYHWEIMPLTFGRARIIWTDGLDVERGY